MLHIAITMPNNKVTMTIASLYQLGWNLIPVGYSNNHLVGRILTNDGLTYSGEIID